MGTSALISLGTSAMFANYAAMQTVGQNIANANTEGYSRQSVELANMPGQYSGSGFLGKGVNVTTVSRAHDQFLTRESQVSASVSAMDQARNGKLIELQKVFPLGKDGMGYAANQFLNSMVDVSTHPDDPSARQSALASASEAATRFYNAANQLDALQAGVNMDLRTTVASVNQLAKQIADVNDKISAVHASGHPPNDLLDQRDQLVQQLSQYVRVSTMIAPDDSMSVFIGGGQRLVMSNSAQSLVVQPDEYDPSRSRVALVETNGSLVLDPDSLGGGSIAGILQYQNKDLQDARNQIGQLVAAFASEVNKQQALGLDLTSAQGAPGSPLFAFGSPQALPAATNALTAGGTFVSSVGLTIADASQLKASSYELRADPAGTPGSYQLTRLSDGFTQLVTGGSIVDGFQITLSATPPGATDRFLLQPVTRAANSMALIMNKPNGLAAASPVTGTVGANNQGTASIAALSAVLPSTDPSVIANVRADISFTSSTGNYSYNLVDRTTSAIVASGTGTWTPAQAITLNGFQLMLNGVPTTGDTFNVDVTTLPSANNGNALAFMAMRDKPIVGRQLQPSGALTGGANITDAYAMSMSDVGVRVQSADTKARISAAVAANAEQARTTKTGVNLDEEAAQLLQYQQSYQAAAKVLQVAQTIFDTLLQIAAR
jgi:flagellar hook-associated protein 1 FlgK